jgi:hypothetical protein
MCPKCDVFFFYVVIMGCLVVQVLVRGYLYSLRWMVMASPFHHHSQGAWLYFFDGLSLGGGTASKLGIYMS